MTRVPGLRAQATIGADRSSRPRAVLPALCVTQITSWGVVYYAFPVLLPRITAQSGWSAPAASAAFSGALLVSAAVVLPVGRILDRRGPRAVMTAGSVVAVISVLAIAAAPNLIAFAGAWMAAGAAMAATFYQPAFAALTRWYGPDRIRALTVLTLAGGLASTVFAPLTATLAGHLTWRATYAVLAVILAVITVPAHALALRAPWPPDPGSIGPGRTDPGAVTRSRPFILLASALTLSGFAAYAVLIALVPLLMARGASPAQAAWALGLGGLGQTLGRTLYAALARRTSPTIRTALLMMAGGATTAALALVPGPVPLLVGLAVIAGVVRGNLTLLQATAVTDRWGATHYGRRSAVLAAPVIIASAISPFAGTALAGVAGGYPRLFEVLASTCMLAALVSLGSHPQLPQPRGRTRAAPVRSRGPSVPGDASLDSNT